MANPRATEATQLLVLERLGEILSQSTASTLLLTEAVAHLSTIIESLTTLNDLTTACEVHEATTVTLLTVLQDLTASLKETAVATETHQVAIRVHNYLIEALTRAHIAYHCGDEYITEALKAVLPLPPEIIEPPAP